MHARPKYIYTVIALFEFYADQVCLTNSVLFEFVYRHALYSKYVLPHMRISAHTRMGRPIRVWDVPYAYGISRTRMGQYYGRPI